MRKRTELPPELVAEWADDRTIEEVLATPHAQGGGTPARVKWRCRVETCGHEWVAIINERLNRGTGCPVCAIQARSTKRRKLPHELAVEWADKRSVEDVKIESKVKWRCGKCRHEWIARLRSRLRGRGCPACARNLPGSWKNHKDFPLISEYVGDAIVKRTQIRVPCVICGKSYLCEAGSWLRGSRRHFACAKPRRTDWQQPPNMICLEPEKRATANALTPLRFRHATCGHEIQTTLKNLDTAARKGTPGCARCANNTPLSVRFREEAPDLLQHLTTPPKALAVLAAIGADKGALGVAYRNALHLTQKGVSAIEAVRRVAKEMDDNEDDTDTGTSATDDVPLLPAGTRTEALPSPTEIDPTLWSKQRLERALKSNSDINGVLKKLGHSIDESTCYQFFIDAGLSELRDGYCDAETVGDISPTDFLARVREETQSPSKLASIIATQFLTEIDGALALQQPRYFKPMKNGEPLTLTMMQRLIAWHMMRARSFGNWSAPGAGKTIGALFASTMLESQLTVVLCPLQVVPTWANEIDATFASGKRVYRTHAQGTWTPPADTNFLLVHYEMLQQRNVEADIEAFVRMHGSRVGLIVVDEVHRGKNDGSIGQGDSASARRAAIQSLTSKLPKAKLLIQTGTPLQTKCAEAISLLHLIDDNISKDYGFTGRTGLSEAIRIHWAMSRYGVRFKPRVRRSNRDLRCLAPTVEPATEGDTINTYAGYKLNVPKAPTNLAPIVRLNLTQSKPLLDLIRKGKRLTWLAVDELLTPHKLSAIVAAARKGSVVYTEHVGVGSTTPIVKIIAKALQRAGFSTAIYDGRSESVKGHDVRKGEKCPCPRCDGMRKYKAGAVDVLIASRTLGEGVEGLQLFGNRVIINAPPWHNSAWQQLLGRWHRKGQTRDVEVIVPIVILTTEGGHEISLDLDRLGRVNRTATLADCVLDGIMPTAQSQQSVLETARKQLEGMT